MFIRAEWCRDKPCRASIMSCRLCPIVRIITREKDTKFDRIVYAGPKEEPCNWGP